MRNMVAARRHSIGQATIKGTRVTVQGTGLYSGLMETATATLSVQPDSQNASNYGSSRFRLKSLESVKLL